MEDIIFQIKDQFMDHLQKPRRQSTITDFIKTHAVYDVSGPPTRSHIGRLRKKLVAVGYIIVWCVKLQTL